MVYRVYDMLLYRVKYGDNEKKIVMLLNPVILQYFPA